MNKLRFIVITFIVILFITALGASASQYPSLWDSFDLQLQRALESSLNRVFKEEFWRAVKNKKAAIVVVDITDLEKPKVAGYNPDHMMYAASMPKLAILLGVFVMIERGELKMDEKLKESLTRMIRKSSNKEATANLNRVGIKNLAKILRSARYRLYDPAHNGGLWIGRDYSGGPVWKLDPLHNISHGATAMQVARLYYLGITHRLVPEHHFADLRKIMSKSGIKHKFVKGLLKQNPKARIYRKSGTWREFHADSGVIVDDESGYKYILVALAEHPQGAKGMAMLVEAADNAVRSMHE
jgi:beta-lactamase class A